MVLIFLSDSVNVNPAEDTDATPLEPESEHHYIYLRFFFKLMKM